MALPGATPQAAAVAGSSDHDSVVGRLAIGYLGRNTVGIGALPVMPAGGPTAADGPDGVDTPVIGVRYWLSDMLGIDAGIGFGIGSSGSSADNGTTTVDADGASTIAVLLHGGVPLSLASAGHFSFQVVPELNVGFASRSATKPDPLNAMGEVDVSAGGFHFDMGAHAGAEIHFGFIGIPQLSLQGSLGARLAIDATSTEDVVNVGGVNQTVKTSQSTFRLNTTVGDNPWNIFTSNVAALYYF